MKNKILWKFLWAYIPLILIAVLVLNFFVSISLRRNLEEKIAERLLSDARLISYILIEDLQNNHQASIQKKIEKLSSAIGVRITVIKDDGVVLGDSDENPQEMVNHKDRPEIVLAREKYIGYATRLSETLNTNMKYLALKVKNQNNDLGFIRVALPLAAVDTQIRDIYQSVLIGGILAMIVTFIVGYFISRSIAEPIQDMKNIAQRISLGDFSRKVKHISKDELGVLAQSLNKMSDDFQTQINNLKKMDRIRTDFIANVSHELKTPLTAIKGLIETLENGAIEDKETAMRFIKIIRKRTNSLTNIVNDLLSLCELESKELQYTKKDVDLKALLDEVIMSFGYALKEKNHTLVFKTDGEDFHLRAIKSKIEQIFINLINNAIKYSNNEGEISVFMKDQKDAIILEIKDNGIGIPEKDLPRIFERFYRVDKAHSREIGGTGLGLSIVKHIVQLHLGNISIQSEVSKGTTVQISFPRV